MTARENWNAARAAEAKAKNSGDEEKIIVVQGRDVTIYHITSIDRS